MRENLKFLIRYLRAWHNVAFAPAWMLLVPICVFCWMFARHLQRDGALQRGEWPLVVALVVVPLVPVALLALVQGICLVAFFIPYSARLRHLGRWRGTGFMAARCLVDRGRHEVRLIAGREAFVGLVPSAMPEGVRGWRPNLLRSVISVGRERRRLPSGVIVSCNDPDFLEAHLARPGVIEAWGRLLACDGVSRREVCLLPGAVSTFSFHGLPSWACKAETVEQWLADMELLLGPHLGEGPCPSPWALAASAWTGGSGSRGARAGPAP